MKPIAAEWVAKAEGDFATLERESRVRKHPNYDGICFHAQQCAEKYLKALLAEAGVRFSKIHDLDALLELVLPIEPSWVVFREDLAYLSDFAVAFRYPGESADRESAISARKRCRLFRDAARKALRVKGD
jgi:HEPN domain-containing protein